MRADETTFIARSLRIFSFLTFYRFLWTRYMPFAIFVSIGRFFAKAPRSSCMIHSEPALRWFETEAQPSRYNLLLSLNCKVITLCALSCFLGTLILWRQTEFDARSESDTCTLWKFLGVVLNLPVLVFLFKAYQVILGPLARSIMERRVDDLPMPWMTFNFVVFSVCIFQ